MTFGRKILCRYGFCSNATYSRYDVLLVLTFNRLRHIVLNSSKKLTDMKKTRMFFKFYFLRNFSTHVNVLDGKIHRFKIVCTTKNRIDQIFFDKMLCILHVESTRSALERHFLGVPTAWIFTETPLIKFDMIFDV